MDHNVIMPIPVFQDRLTFSLREFKKTLIDFVNPENRDILYKYENDIIERKKAEETEKKLNPRDEPETERPSSSTSISLHQLKNLSSFADNDVDLPLCVDTLVQMSDGWSFRELSKFYSNVRSTVLGNER